jgi:hypothetical protein
MKNRQRQQEMAARKAGILAKIQIGSLQNTVLAIVTYPNLLNEIP